MIYEKYTNNNVLAHIENINDNNPYTAIGNKAFLSCKNVYEIKLPDTICEIGDWAFAHMKDLKKIIVPSRKISIGRDAFLDCNNLQEIVIYPDNSCNKGLSYLLASCVTILKSYELVDFEIASNQNEKWCRLYDEELLRYIKQPDDRGFQPFIVGWFNDEGEEEQLASYIEKEKNAKISLCFLRLKYNNHLNDNMKNEFISYINNKLEKGKDETNTCWIFFRDNLSDDIQYVKIAAENNMFDSESKTELITYINKRNGNPEIAAYLLALTEEKKTIEQIFEL